MSVEGENANQEGVVHIPKRRGRGGRVGCALLALLLTFTCIGSVALLFTLDQTSAAGSLYLQSVNTGNTWLAELLGDHYTSDKDWHQQLYRLDIQRDLGRLQGAELQNVTSTREQTLSGQWVTMVRFQWRPAGSNAQWEDTALRVKTDSWLFITYVRAVEDTQP